MLRRFSPSLDLSVVEAFRTRTIWLRFFLAFLISSDPALPALTPAAWRRIQMSWVGWRRPVDRGKKLRPARQQFEATLVSLILQSLQL